MAKNYVFKMNDQIHAEKKRKASMTVHSSNARKIRKLASNEDAVQFWFFVSYFSLFNLI